MSLDTLDLHDTRSWPEPQDCRTGGRGVIPGDFSIPVLVSDTGPNGPGRAISYVEATDVELSELYVELAVFAANVRAEIAEKQHAVNAELLRRMNAAEKRVA